MSKTKARSHNRAAAEQVIAQLESEVIAQRRVIERLQRELSAERRARS